MNSVEVTAVDSNLKQIQRLHLAQWMGWWHRRKRSLAASRVLVPRPGSDWVAALRLQASAGEDTVPAFGPNFGQLKIRNFVEVNLKPALSYRTASASLQRKESTCPRF